MTASKLEQQVLAPATDADQGVADGLLGRRCVGLERGEGDGAEAGQLEPPKSAVSRSAWACSSGSSG